MGEEKEKPYQSISIPKELYQEIVKTIEEMPHLGYKSAAEFVKEAVREKLFAIKNMYVVIREEEEIE